MSRTRVAIVVQRYGTRIGGGAEEEARLVAELLAPHLDVTVLTTCAQDYRTWQDAFDPGEEIVNGVRVLRFSVPTPRDPKAFDRMTGAVFAAPGDLELGMRWMHAQGPVAPDLLDHLRDRGASDYDAVVFVTYLYATTVLGLPLVADRSLFLPTLHDEPPARLSVFDGIFRDARMVVFNTPEERDFAGTRFGVPDERAVVAGIGVDPPPEVSSTGFAAARGIERAYAVCVGRLDPSKGTDALIDHHRAYRERHPDGLDLVMVGKGAMTLPDEPWLTATGYVDDTEKHEAIAGAAVVVLPSPYESLSISQLDAYAHGRPTLANAASPVLEGNSRRTGGGLWYHDTGEYVEMLDMLARNPALAAAVGRQGRHAVRTGYSWDRVREVWLQAIGGVAGGVR